MKTVILFVTIILTGFFNTNAQEKTFNLTVHISGLSSNKGKLMVGLYNQKDQFLKTTFKGEIVSITTQKGIANFKNVPEGEYAISFIHDENNNQKMDTNFMGIPKEDYGCSNNARGFMGPPKYEDAKFQLTANKSIHIKI